MLDLIPLFCAIALSVCALWYAYNVEKRCLSDAHSLDDLAAVIISQDEELVTILAALDMLQRDMDICCSGGQPPPENTKKSSAPKVTVAGNTADLNDGLPLEGHGLIVGKSGSGKSYVLMTQIIRRIKAGQEVHCIDTKDEIAPIFGEYVECVTPAGADKKIKDMLKLASERRDKFKAATKQYNRPCRNFHEYKTLTGEDMPVVCLIVEELIVLMGIIDEDPLIEMLVVCRSAGVFVVCLAQVIKADILSRKGTLNFNWQVWLGKYDRIAANLLFGDLDKIDTKMIADHVGEPGAAAIQMNGEIVCTQMPNVTEDYLIPFISGAV